MLSTIGDREVDALLAGAPMGAGELEPLAAVVRSLRRLAEREPVPPMSDALRAQLGSVPVLPIRVHHAMRASLVKTAAAAAASVLMGVGAAQNRLPTGIQDVVSSTAHVVGVDVPRSAERGGDGGGVGSGQGEEQRGDGEQDDTTGDTSPSVTVGGNDGEPGYDGVTPGGATPADPGVPADKEPATPATPPTVDSNHDGNQRPADPGPDDPGPDDAGEHRSPTG